MENPELTPTTQPDLPDEEALEDIDADIPSDEELDIPAEDDDTPLLQWETQEPASPPRPHSWYIIMGLIAAAIIIVAIITQVWVIIPLAVLIPIALTMYGNKGPGEHAYSLEPFGVRVDDKPHSYDGFKAFFVVESKEQVVFELIPLQRLGALVTLHADNDVAPEVMEILSSVLPETQPQGYFGESVFKRLKL